MIGWLLNLTYGLAIVATSPMWLWRMIRHGRYRHGLPQRLAGAVPQRYGLQPTIWVHGVSLGEVNAARPLVAEIHSQLPDYRVVISSTTDTGMAAAVKGFCPEHMVCRWPMDFTFAVNKALDRIRPALVVLMEGDVWPNFMAACRRRGIPVVVVNARLGPKKGYPRYRLIRPLAARLFNSLTAIGVQHESYADLFARLGVLPEKLQATGMLKFDSADLSPTVKGQGELAAALGLKDDCPLLVAGGTGVGEERIILDAFGLLAATNRGRKPRLVIVPRKPERFGEVAGVIRSRGYKLLRRSAQADGSTPAPADDAVILGDTMGDLRKFYALATGCFVGRSLVGEGGSDMIEAAALGKPVAFGPHTFNFPQAQSLVEAGGALRVHDARTLAAAWQRWLSDPSAAAAQGQAAAQYVRSQQGSTRKNVAMICRVLGRVPALRPGNIATDAVAAS